MSSCCRPATRLRPSPRRCGGHHAGKPSLVTPMLELRPNCECCDTDLPADSAPAFICSFECTFCAACADARLAFVCPNCGGELVARPRRPVAKLAVNPASTLRVYKPHACSRVS